MSIDDIPNPSMIDGPVWDGTWWGRANRERRDWCATNVAYHVAVAHPGKTTTQLFVHWHDPDTVSGCVQCQQAIVKIVEWIRWRGARKMASNLQGAQS